MKDINEFTLHPIARFSSPFASKFGIPKQSGLVEKLEGAIEFEPEYRNRDMLRGIENFDYLWLLWQFSANPHAASSPLVRPPLLGGNEKVGVFASRSPFRPNAVGLSSVRLSHVDYDSPHGPIIHVLGADLMDGTPIFDIKPYVSLSDSHPDARCGFVDSHPIERLKVEIPEKIAESMLPEHLETLRRVLELDPRPHYHNSENKAYGMPFMDYDVRFRVKDSTLYVTELVRMEMRGGRILR